MPACAFPVIAKRFPRLRIPPAFLFFARHFGTGVLIATAFVHLLPTAFVSLTNSCLSDFWTSQYPAMAGAIAMLAVFLVTVVEMVFTKGICGKNYSAEDYRHATLESGRSSSEDDGNDFEKREAEKRGGCAVREEEGVQGVQGVGGESPLGSRDSEQIGGRGGLGNLGFGIAGRRGSRSHSLGQGLQRFSHEMAAGRARDGIVEESNVVAAVAVVVEKPAAAMTGHAHAMEQLTPAQKHKKAMLQVFLLELGILFHSVFIGMALSVTVGPPFIVLFIAIVFHQTFEGLALGSRIANLKWKTGAYQPWLMALAYGLTTPVGQAIGLGTRMLYQPGSQTGLLMVGIMNAISSGLLLFAGLVELLAVDFLSDESWDTLKGRGRIVAFLFVIMGAAGMAIVGAWA